MGKLATTKVVKKNIPPPPLRKDSYDFLSDQVDQEILQETMSKLGEMFDTNLADEINVGVTLQDMGFSDRGGANEGSDDNNN